MVDMEPWDPLDHPARIEVRRQESDDSDAEGGLGNVTRIVLRPPGHSGKAKRGHLCFDASYESGNLGRVDFISEYEYDLFIRPDTCNPRFRLWFNFVVDNVRQDQRVIFNLVNLCKIKTLYRDGMTPLVKTTSRPKWQRLPGKYVYYHKSPEHRNHYILSFAFAFDREEDVYQFAFSFPYSYARCQAHLDLIEQKEFSYFRREIIGYTLQNRKLEVITIGNPSLLVGKRSKVVVILARCHPGESPSSYVAQGIMDFMISNHSIATTLREHLVIKIIPMINPDGVYLGNFRCSLMGYDLNRQWNQISPWAHPTLSALKNYLVELDSSKNLELDLVLDLHAHTSLMGAFIHGNAYDDVYRFERHILFPKLLAHNAEDYNPSHTMYNRDPVKAGTARRHLCEILRNTVNVYTLEASFFGYNQPTTNAVISYNEDGYFRLGRNIVRTFFEYFRVTGVIPVTAAAPPASGNQNQEPEKKKTIRRKSRSRSRSRPKSRENGEKASSPMQKTAVSNGGRSGDHTPTNPRSKDGTPERTVVKMNQLTAEHDTDSSGSSSSDNDCGDSKAVKFTSAEPAKKIQQRRSTRGRLNMRAMIAKSTLPIKKNPDSSPSPPATPKRGPSPGKSRTAPKHTFTTFDFSKLHDSSFDTPNWKGMEGYRSHPRKHRTRTRPSRSTTGRKIGGGGIVSTVGIKTGKEIQGTIKPQSHQLYNSDTDTDAPCLTIIDFNLLLRKGLDGRSRANERGWKGGRSGKANNFKTGIAESVTDGGYVGLSCGGGEGSAGMEGANKQRRREVRRRRAALLRGTLTDWWEDTSSDSGGSASIIPISKKLDGLNMKYQKPLNITRSKSSKACFSS